MTKNDLIYDQVPRMPRGSFRTFAENKFRQIDYPDQEVADKFFQILKKVCINKLEWDDFEFKDILDPVQCKRGNYFVDKFQFEEVLGKAFKKGLFMKPEEWQDLKIYEIVEKLFELANEELNTFIRNDAFRAGSFFIDMKDDKVDLLISLGNNQLARIPAERMSFDRYLDMRYPSKSGIEEAKLTADDILRKYPLLADAFAKIKDSSNSFDIQTEQLAAIKNFGLSDAEAKILFPNYSQFMSVEVKGSEIEAVTTK